MVSKSANYCFTNHRDNTGVLLLCEVALGDMYERHVMLSARVCVCVWVGVCVRVGV